MCKKFVTFHKSNKKIKFYFVNLPALHDQLERKGNKEGFLPFQEAQKIETKNSN